MPKFEIREGDGNDGCYHRGYVEASDAFEALRLASRRRMIYPTRDVRITQDIEGDSLFAVVASYVRPIYGDSCRWVAQASIVEKV